ncbi:MAG: flagellar hook-basal body complex protein FliE [Thiotrichales bacterium]|nr:flagellar hook-basal body complex protein FliE [Thiotrichales bacterium]
MTNTNVSQLIAEMRIMAQQAQGNTQNQAASQATNSDFVNLLKSSIDKVSETQKQAGNMAERFELGDKSVDLAEVMVNLQKANVSFQAMTQVRNRLVSAYKEIMNMQI